MNKITVGPNETLKTISEAIKFLKNDEENELHILRGTYYEKVKIVSNNLKIIGEDREGTIIVYDDYSKKLHKDGLEYNTFRTYTMMVIGENIRIENLTIKNTSGDSQTHGQAVALHLIGNNITLDNLNIKSEQDTLFLGPLPKDLIERYQGFLEEDELVYPKEHKMIIENSYIEGDVDFVFGNATAYFDRCVFYSLKREGFVFAPSTDKEDEYGFIVNNSIFKGESKTPNTYIARPWRDYGMLVVMNSLFENHIYPLGYDKWHDTERDKTCRFIEYNSHYRDGHQVKRCEFIVNATTKNVRIYEKEKIFGK
ncbi:MAG: pectin esterase [Gammaproteobacteria bacterium]|nr:pectin esterase [Gammaproteobacteria bacterium]